SHDLGQVALVVARHHRHRDEQYGTKNAGGQYLGEGSNGGGQDIRLQRGLSGCPRGLGKTVDLVGLPSKAADVAGPPDGLMQQAGQTVLGGGNTSAKLLRSSLE